MSHSQSDTLAAEAAAHWESLALDQERYATDGLVLPAIAQSRATMYRQVAKALRLEAETGKPHCSICFGNHPNHQHGHIG